MKVMPKYKPISESSTLAFGLQVMHFKALALAYPGQLVTSHVVQGGLYDHVTGRRYPDRLELTSNPDGKLSANGVWHAAKLNGTNGKNGGPSPQTPHGLQTRHNDSPHKGRTMLPMVLDFTPEENGFSTHGTIAGWPFAVTRTVLRQDGSPRRIDVRDGEGYVGRRGFALDWALHQKDGDLVPSGSAKGFITRKYLGNVVKDPVQVRMQVTEPEREFLGAAQTVILRASFPKTSVFNVADVMVCDKQPPLNKRKRGT